MAGEGTAALVRDTRPRMHSIVRPLGEGDGAPGRAPVGRLNALLMARTPLSLLEAAIGAGPLEGAGADGPRSVDPDGLRRLLGSGALAAPDEGRLADECVLDPFPRRQDGSFSMTGRRPMGDARRAAELYGPHVVGDAPLAGRLAVEPLQDWVLLRNLLSVAARLVAVARLEDEGRLAGRGVLLEAGFLATAPGTRGTRRTLGGSGAFSLPVAYNPFFREGGLVANDLGYGEAAPLMCPLLDRLAPTEPRARGTARVRVLGGDGGLLVLTAPQAGVVPGRVAPRSKRPEAERWLYLTLAGDDQRGLADRLLRALDALLGRRRLTCSGYDAEAVPEAHPDAASSLWATLLRHDRHRLATCRQCGRTVLAPLQGPRREFCSDTCRAAFAKHSREPFLEVLPQPISG